MCTVSFIRLKDSVVITSNRDEHLGRENARAPSFYFEKGQKLIFPKDAKAGGTWFAARENGVVAVLLNGAFESHVAKPPYRKSRGLVLLDLVEANDPQLFFTELDLENIEPFTVVLYQPGSLHELRWNGKEKFAKQLNEHEHYIWASATLYTPEVIASRKALFEQFVNHSRDPEPGLVFDFHSNNQGDPENGFIINRQTGMKTFSITQAVVSSGAIRFLHADLLQNKQFVETMQVTHSPINL